MRKARLKSISHFDLRAIESVSLGRPDYVPGFGGSFFRGEGATLPGAMNVAQVFPDSGVNSAVFPGTGGMWIKVLHFGH